MGSIAFPTAGGAIVFTILSAFATFERERIAARIREVKQLKKAQGKFTGGHRAFGYDVVEGVKVPREDEQGVIRQMCAMRDAGAGYRQIADCMITTQDRKMTFMGVKRVLSAAHLLPNEQPIEVCDANTFKI